MLLFVCALEVMTAMLVRNAAYVQVCDNKVMQRLISPTVVHMLQHDVAGSTSGNTSWLQTADNTANCTEGLAISR
jgi:hypothetical protein